MPLTKLQFRPGINRETTSYTNEGGWFDGDKIRFRFGLPEKIGGWVRRSNKSFLGSCRALHPWVTLGLSRYIGVGTNIKYYIEQGGAYNDITPLRATTAAGDVTFAAVDGSSVLTVTDTDHGASVGDFVTFSGAVSLGGDITADILNQEYQIASIVDTSNYTIVAREVATVSEITVDGEYTPTPVAANASDVGSGGSFVVGAYQVSIGLDTAVFGNGWGAGTWSRGAWGSAADISLLSDTLRLWSHDNYGEDLLMNIRDGGIYYWDASAGLATRAVNISQLSGANKAPTVAKQILVSARDRHTIAFGCDPETNPGVQDPLTIRFSSQESLTDWETRPDNTAGELRIDSGSEIVCAIETRQQILVFTDKSLYAMQYLGPPFTFGIGAIAENTSIISSLATVAVGDAIFWMGDTEFYGFAGTVERLPCTVRDYVFDNINLAQSDKICAALNAEHSEVWWFYPSASSDNIDRYVVYNYGEKVWYYGTLNRTAWIDRGIFEDPIAASTDGYLYEHEAGFDDGSTSPATAIAAFVESSQLDLGDGDSFAFIGRLIPDITFLNSTSSTPTATMTLKTRNFPGGTYLQSTDSVIEKTASVPVEQFTNQVNLRLRGRSFALTVSSDDLQVAWRLGSPRIDVRPDGRR